MAYQWPAFAERWNFILPPYESNPFIVPVGHTDVKAWQKILSQNIDWPTDKRMSPAEIIKYKMWIVRPFAQVMMPLQNDYIEFRRKTLETLQALMDAQTRMDTAVCTLAENDNAHRDAIGAQKQANGTNASQITRTETSLVELEQQVIQLQKQVYVLECKMQAKDETIASLVAKTYSWEEVDPGDSVTVLERINAAKNWKQALVSRPVSPHSSRRTSRAPSPAPSGNGQAIDLHERV